MTKNLFQHHTATNEAAFAAEALEESNICLSSPCKIIVKTGEKKETIIRVFRKNTFSRKK